MRAVIQRVTRAVVRVNGETVGAIEQPGYLILVGITHGDGAAQIAKLADKTANLRLLERADVVIYLRYSRAVVMWRVVRRTVRRAVTGQRLWADNVEPPLKNILRDPDNMIRYTWRSYTHVGELLAEARGQHLQKRFIEFRTPRAANQFLRAVQLRGVL